MLTLLKCQVAGTAPAGGAQHGYKVPIPAQRFWRPLPAQRLPVCIHQKSRLLGIPLLAASGVLSNYLEAPRYGHMPDCEDWRTACASSRPMTDLAVFMKLMLRRISTISQWI